MISANNTRYVVDYFKNALPRSYHFAISVQRVLSLNQPFDLCTQTFTSTYKTLKNSFAISSSGFHLSLQLLPYLAFHTPPYLHEFNLSLPTQYSPPRFFNTLNDSLIQDVLEQARSNVDEARRICGEERRICVGWGYDEE